MKRIEYKGTRLKDGLSRIKKAIARPDMRRRTGVLTGIAVILLASLIAFTSLAKMSKDVIGTDADSAAQTDTTARAITTHNYTTRTASTTAATPSSTASTTAPAQNQTTDFKDTIQRSIKPTILLRTTGCTYSYSFTNPDLSFSYDNGKYQCSFPSEWESKIVPSTFKTGGFCVSPDKTAVTCIQNDTIVIVYSDDEGKTWKTSAPILPSQIPSDLTGGQHPDSIVGEVSAKFDFPSKSCGYLLICGGCGMSQERLHDLFKTVDGGKTWKYVDSNFQDSNYVTDMHFTDSKTGYICNSCAAMFQTNVYRTTDGGATWTKTELPLTKDSNAYDKYGSPTVFAPYFIGSKGYILAYCDDNPNTTATFIYCVSSDNGKTWKYAATKYSSDSPPYWEFYP